MRNVVAAVIVILMPAIAAAQAPTPNGEAVYTQHCAACHEGRLPRMPSREALRTLTPEHIDTALSSFSRFRQSLSRDVDVFMLRCGGECAARPNLSPPL